MYRLCLFTVCSLVCLFSLICLKLLVDGLHAHSRILPANIQMFHELSNGNGREYRIDRWRITGKGFKFQIGKRIGWEVVEMGWIWYRIYAPTHT